MPAVSKARSRAARYVYSRPMQPGSDSCNHDAQAHVLFNSSNKRYQAYLRCRCMGTRYLSTVFFANYADAEKEAVRLVTEDYSR